MNFSEIRVALPFFETEIWITPQRSHKCLFYSCKSPLPCLTWLQRKDVLHHQIPSQWHTRNGTRAGIHVQGVAIFASGGVFLLFFFSFSCHPLQHPAAVELIWGENVAWCHLWHGCGDWKTSSRAAQRNGRQTWVRVRLATICPPQWELPLLVSGSLCQSWVTVCRLNINTMQIPIAQTRRSIPGQRCERGLWRHPSLAGSRCSTSAAGSLNAA